jgi:hypothetical protein
VSDDLSKAIEFYSSFSWSFFMLFCDGLSDPFEDCMPYVVDNWEWSKFPRKEAEPFLLLSPVLFNIMVSYNENLHGFQPICLHDF